MARVTTTGIAIDYDVPVPVSDGTVPTADVFRPATVGRYPVILVRTPYGKLATPTGLVVFGFDTLGAVREAYVVVIDLGHELGVGVGNVGLVAVEAALVNFEGGYICSMTRARTTSIDRRWNG